MKTLTTINQLMGIASKAHYLNGGNAIKIFAKDKRGIFTIEQVAETLQCNPDELKELLQQNQIMCGDYVIAEAWGDGEKLSTFALRTLADKINKTQKKQNTFEDAPLSIVIISFVIALYGVNWLFNPDTVTLVFAGLIVAMCIGFKRIK